MESDFGVGVQVLLGPVLHFLTRSWSPTKNRDSTSLMMENIVHSEKIKCCTCCRGWYLCIDELRCCCWMLPVYDRQLTVTASFVTYINSHRIKLQKVRWETSIALHIGVRLVISSALQSHEWQIIGIRCCSALCGHALPTVMDNWTHSAAITNTSPPPSATLDLHPAAHTRWVTTHTPSHWG